MVVQYQVQWAIIAITRTLFRHMKKALLLFTAVTLFSVSSILAQNTVSRSAITFKIKNLGVNTDGTIGGLQATVHFNPADISKADIEASVDVATINTGNSLRDDHIKSDEFFDVAHFPKISIKLVSVKHKSGNKYAGQFNLTIKNKTLPVEIPFTCTQQGNRAEFTGTFTINRRDYGLGENSLTLSDNVIISIDAELKE